MPGSRPGTLGDEDIIRLIRERAEGGGPAGRALDAAERSDGPAGRALDAAERGGGPAYPQLRPAAVLVPLLWVEDQWHLLFTRRTEIVASHKGQVSFPGGAADPEDASVEDTALREAFEEIGLQPQDVRIFGRLASRPTISSFLITPVVGQVRWPNEFHLSAHEVSRVFTIPLDWLADPAHWEERPRTTPNGYYEHVIYYQDYDGEMLWGITARITLDFLKVLGLL